MRYQKIERSCKVGGVMWTSLQTAAESWKRATTSTISMSKSKPRLVNAGPTRCKINRWRSRGVSMFWAVLRAFVQIENTTSTSSWVWPTLKCAWEVVLKALVCVIAIISFDPYWLRISFTVLSDCNQHLSQLLISTHHLYQSLAVFTAQWFGFRHLDCWNLGTLDPWAIDCF